MCKISDAQQLDELQCRGPDSAKDIPGLAYPNLAFLLGHAELARGAVPAAVKLLYEALAGVQKYGSTTGLRPADCFALAEAHAKPGQPGPSEGRVE